MIEIIGLNLKKVEGEPPRKGLPIYEVTEDAYVFLNGEPLFTMKKGFRTDRTSWPRLLRKWFSWVPFVAKWLKDKDNKYTPSSVVHDYALEETTFDKWVCDWLYHGALRSNAVSALEASILVGAVRTRNPGKYCNNIHKRV